MVRKLAGVAAVMGVLTVALTARGESGEGVTRGAPEGGLRVGPHFGIVSIDVGYVTKEVEPSFDVPKNFEMKGTSIAPRLAGVFRLTRLASVTLGGNVRNSSLKGSLAATEKNKTPIDLTLSTVQLGLDAGVGLALSERAGLYLYSGYEGLLTGKGEISGADAFDADLESFTERRIGIKVLFSFGSSVHTGLSTGYSSGKLKWRKLSKEVDHQGFDTSLVIGYSFS